MLYLFDFTVRGQRPSDDVTASAFGRTTSEAIENLLGTGAFGQTSTLNNRVFHVTSVHAVSDAPSQQNLSREALDAIVTGVTKAMRDLPAPEIKFEMMRSGRAPAVTYGTLD